MSNPLVYAHRGFSARYPENTLLAFQKAIEAGADGIECDLQQTQDGVFVVLHDETLDRTSNGKGPVASMNLIDLKLLDFGQGERLPTLRELCSVIPRDKKINIEVKKETIGLTACQRLVDELLKLRDHQSVLVSSFDHELLPAFKARGFRVAMLFGEEHQNLGVMGLLGRVLRIRPHALHLPVQAFERIGASRTRLIIGIFRGMGFTLNFWTVNSKAQYELISSVAGAIITDEVELILNLRQTQTLKTSR